MYDPYSGSKVAGCIFVACITLAVLLLLVCYVIFEYGAW